MILTLEVVSPHPSTLGTAGRQSFGTEGGTIGRARTSDWVLPHSKVSSRHAVITCVNGAFYLEDTSTNGVYVNQSRERLVRGRPRVLRSGDRLVIDPYEIRVTVGSSARAGAPADGSDPFGTDDPFASLPGHPSAPQDFPDVHAQREVDPLVLLGGDPPKAPPRKVPTARDLDAESPLAGHYRPPAVLTPSPAPLGRDSSMIPEGYDPLASDSGAFQRPVPTPRATPRESPRDVPRDLPHTPSPFAGELEPLSDLDDLMLNAPDPIPTAAPPEMVLPPAAPMPAPAVAGPASVVRAADIASTSTPRVVPVDTPTPPLQPVPRSTSANEGLAAMLAGAGLEGVEVTDELARDFGRILNVVVTGVMDVLRARQQIKDEFRMRMTQFRPADNNPLKFSANVDDALHNLLVKRNAAYLPAVEAFEDAFDDLRAHQIAMLAGMRVAFESMLAQFEPARLQDQFDRQLKKGSLLAVPAKLRYWELYREKCETLLADPETSFKKLFGEEFARAYEDQLARLKAEHRAGQTPKP